MYFVFFREAAMGPLTKRITPRTWVDRSAGENSRKGADDMRRRRRRRGRKTASVEMAPRNRGHKCVKFARVRPDGAKRNSRQNVIGLPILVKFI